MLEQTSTKGLWSDKENKCSRVDGGFSGPLKVQGPVSKPKSFGCNRQLSSSGLHKQTRGNSLSRDVRSPVEDNDLVPSLPHNLKSQTHSRVSECDGQPSVQVEPSAVNRMVTVSTGVQTICQKWFTPHVDLFATRLNNKLPLYMSPVPDDNAWDIDALNINWSGLTAYAYPPIALLHRVIRKSDPIIVISPGWPGMPWFWDLVQLSTEIPSQTVPQLCVSQQSTTSQPPRLVSRIGQLQEQGNSVEVAERITAPQRSSTRTIYKSKWALFEKWCRENLVDFFTTSVKQVSDFFIYLYQDLNRHPSTIDGYRTAIVDILGPTGHHISQSSDLNKLLSSFHRDRPKSSRNLPKWNLSVVLNELTKAPFDPGKDTDLKYLTLKTAFLLALGCKQSI